MYYRYIKIDKFYITIGLGGKSRLDIVVNLFIVESAQTEKN